MTNRIRDLDGAELDRLIARAHRLRGEETARLFAQWSRAIREWFGRQAGVKAQDAQRAPHVHGSNLSGW